MRTDSPTRKVNSESVISGRRLWTWWSFWIPPATTPTNTCLRCLWSASLDTVEFLDSAMSLQSSLSFGF
ncbi:hypothetical protein Hanom_Chr05g00447691 [Helianthus anomalus]